MKVQVQILLYEEPHFFQENEVMFNGQRVFDITPYPTNKFQLVGSNDILIATVPFGTLLDVD